MVESEKISSDDNYNGNASFEFDPLPFADCSTAIRRNRTGTCKKHHAYCS